MTQGIPARAAQLDQFPMIHAWRTKIWLIIQEKNWIKNIMEQIQVLYQSLNIIVVSLLKRLSLSSVFGFTYWKYLPLMCLLSLIKVKFAFTLDSFIFELHQWRLNRDANKPDSKWNHDVLRSEFNFKLVRWMHSI